jgi:hypothetical protein
MLRSNMSANAAESGRASLEFLTAAILLLIPILFLSLSLSSIQNATLAADSAARNAVRVFVTETSPSAAATRAEKAVMVALANHGIDQVHLISRRCSLTPCLSPGSVVTITVGVSAPIFSSDLLPGFLGTPSVQVFGEAHSLVSLYGGTP